METDKGLAGEFTQIAVGTLWALIFWEAIGVILAVTFSQVSFYLIT